MRNFTIPCNPYDSEKIYRHKNIELRPGLTVLVGCNGSGKTTLLNLISDNLKKNDISFMSFDNYSNGSRDLASKFIFHGDMESAATAFLSSEGEKIIVWMGNVASDIGSFIRENRDKKEVWILFDAIDSGLSVDNVIDIKECLFDTILADTQDTEVYIIASANEYELCSGEQCFDVHAGKYITFGDYNEYRQFILSTRESKNKRYNKKGDCK